MFFRAQKNLGIRVDAHDADGMVGNDTPEPFRGLTGRVAEQDIHIVIVCPRSPVSWRHLEPSPLRPGY